MAGAEVLVAAAEALDRVFAPSDDVVFRDIAGEVIIVPLTAGIGDMEDELFTLNSTGRAIWEQLDGRRTLREIAADLAAEYEAHPNLIERDVEGFVRELVKRGMLVEARGV